MNNTLYIVAIVALLALAGVLILNPGKTVAPESEIPVVIETQEPVVEQNPVYEKTINTSSSTIVWTGSKKFTSGYKDTGTLSFSRGAFTMNADGSVMGQATVDMNSLTVKKTGVGGGVDTLATHLKSDDFFSVETYPTADFTITDYKNNILSGDLTIKGITKPVAITVSAWDEMEQSIKGTATIQRTDFGIDFRSEGIVGVAKEQIIADEFKLDFTIFYN